MFILNNEEIAAVIKVVIRSAVRKYWPVIEMFAQMHSVKDTHKNPASKKITTFATEASVEFRKGNEVIIAEWANVPGVIAFLRCAITPPPSCRSVSNDQAEAALEMASLCAFKHDYTFTLDDARSVTNGISSHLAATCPHGDVADDIRRVKRLGPKKLFRFVESDFVIR